MKKHLVNEVSTIGNLVLKLQEEEEQMTRQIKYGKHSWLWIKRFRLLLHLTANCDWRILNRH